MDTAQRGRASKASISWPLRTESQPSAVIHCVLFISFISFFTGTFAEATGTARWDFTYKMSTGAWSEKAALSFLARPFRLHQIHIQVPP